ncbi:hypothetical protein ACWCRD_44635 [Streptomyces sp. NPDC002092]
MIDQENWRSATAVLGFPAGDKTAADEGFTTVESGPDSDTMIKIISRQ